MKTKILYWGPSVGLAAGLLSFLALSMLLVALAFTSTAHAKPLPCVESMEHCAPSSTVGGLGQPPSPNALLADAELRNVDDPSMPGLALAQADGLAPTPEPVTTSTPVAIPTDAGAMLTDGEDAAKAFATKDYPYAVGLFLFLLIGAYEKWGTNVVPQKDRILVVLAIPAVGALAGALVMHKPVLASLALAGETLGGTFLAEGGIALLPALKAALGFAPAAPKTTP